MMSSTPSLHETDRRRFPRICAPMYCRPARRRLLRRRKVVDIGLGGMRVYSDESFAIGNRIEVDLWLEDNARCVTCLTEVVWIRELPEQQPTHFDVGLRFLDVPAKARAWIEALIDQALVQER